MITLNLDIEKELVYKIEDPAKISTINFVISFLNNVVYRFPGSINTETNEVKIKINPLSEMIKNEIEANCYLEVILNDGYYYKLIKDTIKFEKTPVTKMVLDSVPADISFDSVYLKSEKTEIPLDMTNIVAKKVSPRKSKIKGN